MDLSFEYDQAGELYIIGDKEGLLRLQRQINRLISEEETHVHLECCSWGGCDMSDKQFYPDLEKIFQVKLKMV